jgi:hypothetical protein
MYLQGYAETGHDMPIAVLMAKFDFEQELF